MPLVPAKCTNCGASLVIDSTKDAAICQYCNTPFVTEKAINNYNISDSVIHIHNEPEVKKDFEIVAGTLIKYNGESANVELPPEVVQIGKNCFRDSPIVSITFTDNVVTIDDYAFCGCTNLRKVELPESLVILGAAVFSECRVLEEVVYPSNVTVNKGSTFEYCRELKKITFNEGTKIIPNEFARDCDSLEEIQIPSSVEYIGTRAFFQCTRLKKVHIPSSVETIDGYAFANCPSLIKVTLDLRVDRRVAHTAFFETPWQRAMWGIQGKCTNCGGKLFFGKCLNCFGDE